MGLVPRAPASAVEAPTPQMQDGHTHTPRTPTLFSFTSVSMQKMMTLFVQGVPGPDRKLRQTLEPPLSPSPLPPPPSPSIGSRYRGQGQGSTSHIQAQSLPPQSSHPFYSGHPPLPCGFGVPHNSPVR